RLVVRPKSVPIVYNTKLLISSAETENGVSPANAIMYQCISVKSNPAGYPTNTGRILSTFPTWIFSIHLTYSGITSSGDRVSFRQASQARSEERRVGKECRYRWSPYLHKKKKER